MVVLMYGRLERVGCDGGGWVCGWKGRRQELVVWAWVVCVGERRGKWKEEGGSE